MLEEKIKELVHKYYWEMDINCARTTVNCLGCLFDVTINPQTLNAAIGLHGAGGFRAQCGLVEGSLMFLGIYYSHKGKTDAEISSICYQFADVFMNYFSSLKCYDLRPNGFSEADPPHACESLTVKAITFTYNFIQCRL